MVATAVKLTGITKRFPGVLANDSIDLQVTKGEIHAIVGENGAGKSTLMKILAGLYQPDAGQIFIFGQEQVISSPARAIELKIGMVHQHFMLIPRFTVLENIVLGAERKHGVRLDTLAARREVTDLCQLYNFALELEAPVGEISVGQAQRVEILKVLYRGADILVLDEPTAVLAPQEVKELFNNLRRLKDDGKTIIFISHKLDEVLEIADRVTVLRKGKLVGTAAADSVSQDDLAQMMVGRPVVQSIDKEEGTFGAAVLSLVGLTLQETGDRAALSDLSLEVRAGEIYGIAGIEGNGQKELAEAVIGLRQPTAGQILISGQDTKGLDVAAVRALGVAYISEDRHRQGLVLPMKVWENMILGLQRRQFYRRPRLEVTAAQQFSRQKVEEYSIALSSIQQKAESLSGGNQQKVILARELAQEPQMIVAAQPTRGLDIGAAEFVHRQLLAKRQSGCAILFISADLDEVLSIADRVGVIYNGRIVAEFRPEEVTAEELGVYMLGGRKKAGGAA